MTLWTKSHLQGSKFMINRRLALGMIAAITTIDASRVAFAKEKHHLNGKDLLGDRIKRMASTRSIRPGRTSMSLPK